MDRLQAVTQVDHESPRQQIEITSDIDAVNQYLSYVDWYEHGIRLDEDTVTRPEILARHELDREPVAVALDEYLDPDMNYRPAPGYLVLLPQPAHLDDDFLNVIRSLEELGEHYRRRQELADITDKRGNVSLEKVLEQGEGDLIEFKEELPDNTTKFAKDLVAFANKRGGILVVGVDDEQSIVGVDDVDETKNRIAGVVHSGIDPPLDPEMQSQQVEEKAVLTVRVERGRDRPYSTEDKIYWRFGPTSRSISGPEFRRLIG